MKNFLLYSIAHLVLIALLLLTLVTFGNCIQLTTPSALDISVSFKNQGGHRGGQLNEFPKGGIRKEEVPMEMYPTGSSLPDCTHACGPCSPCKRVMVGYKCPLAESCPVVYRCMCKGRYYQVPSN